MKIKNNIAATIFSLCLTTCAIAAPSTEHYIFEYGKDMIFDVKLTDNTITWESLAGPDKGQKETDLIERKVLSSDVEVMQWTENDGTFVTVIFDRNHLNVISSGKYPAGTWLRSGIAYITN